MSEGPFASVLTTRRTAGPPRGGRALFVISPEGARRLPLPETGELVIGRSRSAEVRIDDPAASRRHASLVLRPDGVALVDHGSQNGTTVSGEPVRGERALAAGEVIEIGETALVLSDPRRSGPDSLAARLEGELLAAETADRPLAVLALRGRAAPPPAPGTIGPFTASEGLHYLLAPGHDGEAASALARALGGTIGVAVAPRDGSEASTLLSAARTAALEGGGEARRAFETRAVGGREVIVADPAMKRLHALVARLSRADLSVLVQGETGSGKEVIARALHDAARPAGPFVAVNAAALTESLAESELFGHERGAFTGAAQARAGLFEAAHGGTIFLDEVAELSPAMQARLLRVLEERAVVRVGASRPIPVDVRVVSATHVDLDARVAEQKFREDLLHRLAGARLVVPPLRERPLERSILAERFLEAACARMGEPVPRLTGDAWRALTSHTFPGNVRELRNLMELLAATLTEPLVEPEHLDEALASAGRQVKRSPRPAPSRSLQEELRALERARIEEALAAEGANQRRAAQRLGMPLRTLATRLAQLGLRPSDRRER